MDFFWKAKECCLLTLSSMPSMLQNAVIDLNLRVCKGEEFEEHAWMVQAAGLGSVLQHDEYTVGEACRAAVMPSVATETAITSSMSSGRTTTMLFKEVVVLVAEAGATPMLPMPAMDRRTKWSNGPT
jgi:hypothetical protein